MDRRTFLKAMSGFTMAAVVVGEGSGVKRLLVEKTGGGVASPASYPILSGKKC
ncbi:MAG: hypothetical protein ACYCUV_11285 [Phycisphaerae bacterium]